MRVDGHSLLSCSFTVFVQILESKLANSMALLEEQADKIAFTDDFAKRAESKEGN